MDRVYMLPEEPVELGGASQDIVLTEENPEALVMTLYWSGDGKIKLTDDNLQAPVNVSELTIELADNDLFENLTRISAGTGVYEYRFYNEDFNKQLIDMGFAPGVSSPLWIRVRSTLAPNMEPFPTL